VCVQYFVPAFFLSGLTSLLVSFLSNPLVATRSDQKQGLDIQSCFSTWNPLSSLKPSSLSQLTHPLFSWSQPMHPEVLKSFSPCCDCSILVISSQQSVNGVSQSENRIQTVVQFDWLIRLALLLPDIARTLKVTAWLTQIGSFVTWHCKNAESHCMINPDW